MPASTVLSINASRFLTCIKNSYIVYSCIMDFICIGVLKLSGGACIEARVGTCPFRNFTPSLLWGTVPQAIFNIAYNQLRLERGTGETFYHSKQKFLWAEKMKIDSMKNFSKFILNFLKLSIFSQNFTIFN